MHKPLSRFAVLLAVALSLSLSLSLSGHEERVLKNQRRAIRERVEATRLCPRSIPAATRGATRGGALRSAAVLPPEVQYFNDDFSLVLPAELSLPYGAESDPQSHWVFRHDPYEGEAKRAIQEELGLRWRGSEAPEIGPTWMEMAMAYRAALARRGIAVSTTFVPALVLYRGGGSGTKREYRVIDPIADES